MLLLDFQLFYGILDPDDVTTYYFEQEKKQKREEFFIFNYFTKTRARRF